MIELHLDLKFHMKPWKKALLFSLLFYLIILFIFIAIITFMLKGFKFGLVSIISVIYLGALFFGFRNMYRGFEEKFKAL
jgi:membrane protein required for beta-lactamase induction